MDYSITKEQRARLARLVFEQNLAKLHGKKDQFNLAPVEKGFIRGIALNIKESETTCEYGVLKILDFKLFAQMKDPGIPIRMTGTYFDGRIMDGHVLDIEDPDPSVRPLITNRVYFSHHNRQYEMRAHYPGRGDPPRRRSLWQAVLTIISPAIGLLAVIAALYALHILR